MLTCAQNNHEHSPITGCCSIVAKAKAEVVLIKTGDEIDRTFLTDLIRCLRSLRIPKKSVSNSLKERERLTEVCFLIPERERLCIGVFNFSLDIHNLEGSSMLTEVGSCDGLRISFACASLVP